MNSGQPSKRPTSCRSDFRSTTVVSAEGLRCMDWTSGAGVHWRPELTASNTQRNDAIGKPIEPELPTSSANVTMTYSDGEAVVPPLPGPQ